MKYLSIILLLALFIGVGNNNRAYQANKAFQEGDYSRAEELYRHILSNQPDNTEVLFNLGNALVAQGKTEASVDVFKRFRELEQNPAKQALADYNLGYIHESQGNEHQAMDFFRQVLSNNPADEDAKFNYELLRRRLQEPPEEDDDSPDEEDPDEQPDPESGGDPPPESDPSDEGQDESDSSDQDQSPDSEEQQQDGQTEVSREQLRHAEDIMNALEHIEKDLIKDFNKRQVDPVRPHEKDW